jgi:hypothetical protein
MEQLAARQQDEHTKALLLDNAQQVRRTIEDLPHVSANRKKLVALLKRLGIAVELWPSA